MTQCLGSQVASWFISASSLRNVQVYPLLFSFWARNNSRIHNSPKQAKKGKTSWIVNSLDSIVQFSYAIMLCPHKTSWQIPPLASSRDQYPSLLFLGLILIFKDELWSTNAASFPPKTWNNIQLFFPSHSPQWNKIYFQITFFHQTLRISRQLSKHPRWKMIKCKTLKQLPLKI